MSLVTYKITKTVQLCFVFKVLKKKFFFVSLKQIKEENQSVTIYIKISSIYILLDAAMLNSQTISI